MSHTDKRIVATVPTSAVAPMREADPSLPTYPPAHLLSTYSKSYCSRCKQETWVSAPSKALIEDGAREICMACLVKEQDLDIQDLNII